MSDLIDIEILYNYKSFNDYFEVFSKFIISEVWKLNLDKPKSNSMLSALKLQSFHHVVVRMGYVFEKSIKYTIDNCIYCQNLLDIHPTIDGKQVDIIFKIRKTIYCFEVKFNCNLDTEKSLAIQSKLKVFKNTLTKIYPNFNIVVKMLCFQSKKVKPKKALIDYTINYVDFFELLFNTVEDQRMEELFDKLGTIIQKRYLNINLI